MKIDQLQPLLPKYLARQRWFAGGAPKSVEIADSDEIGERLHWLLVDADGARYQLLVGIVEGMPPEFLHGHDAESSAWPTARWPTTACSTPSSSRSSWASWRRTRRSPVSGRWAPSSRTRRSSSTTGSCSRCSAGSTTGPNPDIEVTAALADAGFEHVAAPVATWEESGTHLAVVQPYLAGGTDGWALALTSLRDLYGSECEDPADCGGDFAAEARRLGPGDRRPCTSRSPTRSARALLTPASGRGSWSASSNGSRPRSRGTRRPTRPSRSCAPWRRRAQSLRVHGDYHLGQVLRTDTGWFVLDFEGEPARPLDERRERSSPLKDVAGMLRSFHYATAVVLREREDFELEALAPKAEAWEARNRAAFLDGYFSADGIDDLLPPSRSDADRALRAWELDKAVYEVAYERDHRPDWVDIPESAIGRLTRG